MNIIERPAVLAENGVVSIAPFSLLGGKTMRLDLRDEVTGTFVPSLELVDQEIDAVRMGIVENGFFYLRNFGASAVELSALGRIAKKRGRKEGVPQGPKKKKAAPKSSEAA